MTAGPHGQTPEIRYRAYGLILSCHAQIHELAHIPPPDSSEKTDLHIIFSPPGEQTPAPSDWHLTVSLADDATWMRCAKVSSGYLLHFPNLASFLFDTSVHSIRCIPEPKTPLHTLHHLLLDQVLPLVLNYSGKEVLHGAAVATPHGACAFVGETGAGKSTLAASFLSAGYSVLADDCVTLDIREGSIAAIPAYPSLRLWDDAIAALFGTTGSCAPIAHYTPKQRFMGAQASMAFCTSPIPLAGIYVLGTDGSQPAAPSPLPIITSLTERDALMTLLSLAFKLDIRDQQRLTRELDFLHRLVSHIPVRRLAIPDSLATLPAVRDAILQDLAQPC